MDTLLAMVLPIALGLIVLQAQIRHNWRLQDWQEQRRGLAAMITAARRVDQLAADVRNDIFYRREYTLDLEQLARAVRDLDTERMLLGTGSLQDGELSLRADKLVTVARGFMMPLDMMETEHLERVQVLSRQFSDAVAAFEKAARKAAQVRPSWWR